MTGGVLRLQVSIILREQRNLDAKRIQHFRIRPRKTICIQGIMFLKQRQ